MGAGSSGNKESYAIPDVADVDVPTQYIRMNDGHNNSIYDDNVADNHPLPNARLFTPPFFGKWSIITPNQIGPSARTGHFTVVDDDNQIAYVGYGTSSTNTLLADLWALDLTNYHWREIKLLGTASSPRNGARAVLINRKLFVFGGFLTGAYMNDFQAIDIDTGIVTSVDTTGQVPDRRSTPIMVAYKTNVYLWGGYNGQWPNSIHVLDTQSLVWTSYPCSEKGRTSIPYIVYKNCIVAYGGSHTEGVFTLNMDNNEVKIVPTLGFAPPCDVMSSGMVRVDNLAFYFGGKAKDNNWTILYALDIEKQWWFIFHVHPDGDTVTYADGNISDNGIFMLPRVHSFGVGYSKANRTIVAFLGQPFSDPPHLFLINIGEALSFINLRTDMCEILKL